MVRLTKIYTRQGDGGSTRLVGGQEVEKDCLRIEAYGTVDELNAVIGMMRVAVMEATPLSSNARDSVMAWIHTVQQTLFNLGSDLATRLEDRWEGQPMVSQQDVQKLETDMDRWNETLAPLESFVLPGGGPLTAPIHLARTVCRRAERVTVALNRQEPEGESVIPFLNRLSDAFFVLSRWLAHQIDEDEVLWSP